MNFIDCDPSPELHRRYPLPLWERVVSSASEKPGEGLVIVETDPSPGSHLTMLATFSRKGRG